LLQPPSLHQRHHNTCSPAQGCRRCLQPGSGLQALWCTALRRTISSLRRISKEADSELSRVHTTSHDRPSHGQKSENRQTTKTTHTSHQLPDQQPEIDSSEWLCIHAASSNRPGVSDKSTKQANNKRTTHISKLLPSLIATTILSTLPDHLLSGIYRQSPNESSNHGCKSQNFLRNFRKFPPNTKFSDLQPWLDDSLGDCLS